ncbi:MAG: RsmE family RNA methyltransferase [Spirochaetaceae bacterium]|jgi:RsmE family RNA methyltransferase|nr:RsmE family RNA methyltransferase [Spirochaetaceae bacterium]
MNLILFDETELGLPLELRDGRAVHLIKVLHKKMGDMFDAGVLGGRLGKGCIERIADGQMTVRFTFNSEPPPKLPLRLAVGFPRPIQLRRLLRDVTAFGVSHIDLLESELGDTNYRKTNLLNDGGAEQAFREGLIQASDTVAPSLMRFSSVGSWLASLTIEPLFNRYSLPAPAEVLLAAADNIAPGGSFSGICGSYAAAVLAVGPERGWSDNERGLLEAAGFTRLSFGTRPLRTENACLVSAALVAACLNGAGIP